MEKTLLYEDIARGLATQIRSGILKPGDKLPSVRLLSKQHEIGINTAKRVFQELETLSLVESKPQSGYFVRHRSQQLSLPAVSRPAFIANSGEVDELVSQVYSNTANTDITLFSIGVPSGSLLPIAALKKEVVKATQVLYQGGTAYENLSGNTKLKQAVAIRSIFWGGELHEDDLVTTNGGMNALAFALLSCGKPGDTVAVESPCYPGIFQLAVSLGFKVLELPTHPVTGIEIDALKKALPMINSCLLIPNFNTPLGSCMPDEHKKEVVKLLAENNIPLIEDDIYGDLYFGSHRPKCCKAFDEQDSVILCSSISKTLAPGYRVGWIAPGRYKKKVLQLKLAHSLSSSSIIQEATGNFIGSGKYDRHLRQMRRTLFENYQQYESAIANHFPPGTKTSRPQGGLALWVALPDHVDTTTLYNHALSRGISIAPGKMFTLQNQFKNCMRLCYGMPWSPIIQERLKLLGELATRA